MRGNSNSQKDRISPPGMQLQFIAALILSKRQKGGFLCVSLPGVHRKGRLFEGAEMSTKGASNSAQSSSNRRRKTPLYWPCRLNPKRCFPCIPLFSFQSPVTVALDTLGPVAPLPCCQHRCRGSDNS